MPLFGEQAKHIVHNLFPAVSEVWRLRSMQKAGTIEALSSPIITSSLILRTDNACHVALFASDGAWAEKRQTRLVDAYACFFPRGGNRRPLEMV